VRLLDALHIQNSNLRIFVRLLQSHAHLLTYSMMIQIKKVWVELNKIEVVVFMTTNTTRKCFISN